MTVEKIMTSEGTYVKNLIGKRFIVPDNMPVQADYSFANDEVAIAGYESNARNVSEIGKKAETLTIVYTDQILRGTGKIKLSDYLKYIVGGGK